MPIHSRFPSLPGALSRSRSLDHLPTQYRDLAAGKPLGSWHYKVVEPRTTTSRSMDGNLDRIGHSLFVDRVTELLQKCSSIPAAGLSRSCSLDHFPEQSEDLLTREPLRPWHKNVVQLLATNSHSVDGQLHEVGECFYSKESIHAFLNGYSARWRQPWEREDSFESRFVTPCTRIRMAAIRTSRGEHFPIHKSIPTISDREIIQTTMPELLHKSVELIALKEQYFSLLERGVINIPKHVADVAKFLCSIERCLKDTERYEEEHERGNVDFKVFSTQMQRCNRLLEAGTAYLAINGFDAAEESDESEW